MGQMEKVAEAIAALSPQERAAITSLLALSGKPTEAENRAAAEARKRVPGTIEQRICVMEFYRQAEMTGRLYREGQIIAIPRPGSQEYYDEFRTDQPSMAWGPPLTDTELLVLEAKGAFKAKDRMGPTMHEMSRGVPGRPAGG